MTTTDNIIEIPVKVILLGEFNDFQEWIKNYDACRLKLGLTAQILTIDSKGYTTTGYDLKNFANEVPYPVKTYLLIQDPEVKKPIPYKSPTNN